MRKARIGRGPWVLAVGLAVASAALGAVSDPGRLQQAAEYSRSHRGYALIVMQKGQILLEDYENGSAPGQTHKIYSGTKGFWAVAAMDAARDGILKLDEPVADTIAEWRASGDPAKARITLREVLNFTDGIEPAFKLHGESIADRNRYAIALPVSAAPGTVFTYGPSHLQIFCEVLRRKLAARHDTPYAYLKRKVLNPLGLGTVEYKKDAVGNPLLATGFKLTARQWLRFAEMILHGGTFQGRTVVPASLLAECLHGSTANPAFGIGFWVNSEARSSGAREFDIENMLDLDWRRQEWSRTCVCQAAPADMIVSLGSGYQRLFIIPSMDLIILRQGENAKFSDGQFLRILLKSDS